MADRTTNFARPLRPTLGGPSLETSPSRLRLWQKDRDAFGRAAFLSHPKARGRKSSTSPAPRWQERM
jgi:hypothetical protein